MAAHDAAHWERVLESADTCCTVVKSLEEAVRDLHFQARGVFERKATIPGHVLPALPVPVVPALRTRAASAPAPAIGQDNAAFLGASPGRA